MADKISKEKRSANMSRIKGKNTSLEIKVRKYLYHRGFRYRKNVKDLPGKPDIVLGKYRTIVFVNGCFWHHHYNCRLAVMPKSNTEFWMNKLERNVSNDEKNTKLLEHMGYRVITVWECEIKECFEYRMNQLVEEIKLGLTGDTEGQYEEV